MKNARIIWESRSPSVFMPYPAACMSGSAALRSKVQTVEKPFPENCHGVRSPNDCHRIAWLCRAGSGFGRKVRRQASFFAGLIGGAQPFNFHAKPGGVQTGFEELVRQGSSISWQGAFHSSPLDSFFSMLTPRPRALPFGRGVHIGSISFACAANTGKPASRSRLAGAQAAIPARRLRRRSWAALG